MSIQEAETEFYDIFPNAEHNVIKTAITLDVRDSSDNKLPLEAYKVVKTLGAAQSLVQRHVDPSDNTVWYYDAYPGETISVVDDGSNNGLYFVMGTQNPSTNGLSLHRLMYIGDDYDLQSKTVDPSTAALDIYPNTGYYALSTVHVNAIDSSLEPNLVPNNIKAGVTIFGVTGTYTGATFVNYIEAVSQPTYMLIPEKDITTVEVEIDAYVPSTGESLFGVWNEDNDHYLRFILNYQPTTGVTGGTILAYSTFHEPFYPGWDAIYTDTNVAGGRHTLKFSHISGTTQEYGPGNYPALSIDNSTYMGESFDSDIIPSATIENDYFGLFTVNSGGGRVQPGYRIYGVKWYKTINNVKTLIHDYRPAINTSAKGDLYDVVTGNFLGYTGAHLNFG